MIQGIVYSDNGKFIISDTQKQGDTIILYGKQTEGVLTNGQFVVSEVNQRRRENIKINHSATHLLHAALIKKSEEMFSRRVHWYLIQN